MTSNENALPGLPPAGLHYNVPFDQYLLWPAISNSALGLAAQSMRHFRERIPVEQTDPMRIGSLIHCGRFEPLTLLDRYVVMPAFENSVRKPNGERYDSPKASAAYRELVEDFRARNLGKEVVTKSEYEQMEACVRSLDADPGARYWLDGDAFEVSMVCQDPVTGLWLKGRIDCLRSGEWISDLKTTATLVGFANKIAEWGYDRQAALYGDMLTWLGEPVQRRAIVAMERDGLHLVQAAPLSQRSIEAGRWEYRTLLNQIAECRRTGVWPGLPSPEEWPCPDWRIPDTAAWLDGRLVSW